MGWTGVPVYGEDLASLIEANKKLIAKIESGKYDNETLKELSAVNTLIIEKCEL